MNSLDAPTVTMLTTVAGLSLVTGVIVAVLRRALNLDGQTMDRFGALIAIVVAILLSLVVTFTVGFTNGTDLLQALLNGLFGGLAAAGGFDVLNGAAKAVNNDKGEAGDKPV